MKDAAVTSMKPAVPAAAIRRMNLSMAVPADMIMNTIITRTDVDMIITAMVAPVAAPAVMITATRP